MRLDWKVLGPATAGFFAVTYVVCIGYDIVFHEAMYRARLGLLPGFAWISWASFGLGLLEVITYGLFFGLVFAPFYNLFLVKVVKRAE